MKNESKLTTNYIFNLLNRIIVIIIPLITTPYLTRVLGAKELGIYNYVNTIASYYLMLAMLGMSILGNKLISLSRANNSTSEVFSRLFSIQLLNSMISIFMYVIYLMFFCKSNRTIALIQLFYIISAIFDVSWFLQGLEKFKSIEIRNVFVNCVTTIFIFCFVKNESDLIIYTYIKCISVLVSQLLLIVSCVNKFKWITPKKKEIINIYKQLFILFVPVAAESIFHNMDRVMIGMFIDYGAVAIYYTSRMITDIPQCLVTSINTIMYPRITSLIGQNNIDKANELTYLSFEIINILCIAMAFGISAIASDFVKLYLGNEYQYCAICLPWLAPYIVMAAWNGTVRYQYLLPNSKEKVYSNAIVFGIVTNLFLNLIFINFLGIIGAILATIISEFITGVVQSKAVLHEMLLTKHLRNMIIYCFVGLFMWFIIKYISSHFVVTLFVKIICEVLIGGISYLIIILIIIPLIDDNIRHFVEKIGWWKK